MMKKITYSSLLVAVILLLAIGTASASNANVVFTSILSGSPAGTESQAHGRAVFIFSEDGSAMKFKLIINGLNNTTMAHIHVAEAPGLNGPPVLWLYPDAPPPTLIEGTLNGLLGSNSVTSADFTGSAGITSLDDLQKAILEGRAYVNVHTSAFPAGEIRGDIH